MKYFVKDTTEHANYDFTNSNNKKETVRFNLDKTKFIIGYDDRFATPEMGEGYTNEDILKIIRNPANGWAEEDPIA